MSTLDLSQVRAWLELLHGGCAGLVSVSAVDRDGRMVSQAFAGADLDGMLRWVASMDDTGELGIYARVTTLRAVPSSGRGMGEDSYELPALWADMDIAGPGHATTNPLPETFEQCVEILREAGLPDPTRWVHSGGGYYPFWFLDTPVRLDVAENLQLAKAMSVGWQNAIAAAATRLGWHYGKGVGDLARVLRIPGTVNRKEGLQRSCVLLPDQEPRRYEIGALWASEQAAAAKVAALAPAVPAGSLGPARAEPGEVGDRPGDHWAAQTSWAQILEPVGWRYGYSVGRTEHWIRPDKRTPGISATVNFSGLDNLYVFSTDAAPFEAGGSYTKLAAYALLHHGGDFAAATRQLRAEGHGKPLEPIPARTIWTPPVAVVVGNDHDAFWTSRPSLAAIRRVARERLVSPWAVLGCVLAYVCSRIGPHVVLPPIVGSVASLNLFVALVGPSGGGKDAALAVARELLWLDDKVPTHEVGTGQGIDSAFTVQTNKNGPVQFCDAVLFTVTEIDTLAAHGAMSGATVMATLRKVYTGAALGARYADKFKRRPVSAHHYRAALVAGVQPARSGVLLKDADGGTPQRWLWLPTNDPGARAGMSGASFEVGRFGIWTQYPFLQAVGETEDEAAVPQRDRIEIKVCETARAAIVGHRQTRLAADLAGADDDLTGHELLTRLKVAALLALLDGGRAEVGDGDWDLAGVAMGISNETRTVCAGVLNAARRRANLGKALDEVERGEVVNEHQEQRVAAALLRRLQGAQEWVPGSELRRGLRSGDRGVFEAGINRLSAAGQIDAEQSERGVRYRCRQQG